MDGQVDGQVDGCMNKCTGLCIPPEGYFFANLLCKCLITDLNNVLLKTMHDDY